MMRDGSRKYCDVVVGIGGVFGGDWMEETVMRLLDVLVYVDGQWAALNRSGMSFLHR